MNFADWQALARRSSHEAAREFLRRVARFSAGQRHAIFATLPEETDLIDAFASGVKSGKPLAGVPYVLKDLFDVAGLPTRAGGSFLSDVRPTPTKDGSVVKALGTAGAVFAAKTHLHEFAYGLTGENIHSGDVDHPSFPGRTSGGSSSGSAAAVAAGVVPLGIGTDTGGSIRVPAAFCGIYGFRMVPHHPYIADGFPLAPSFDTAGWFTRTPEDMTTALTTLVGSNTSTDTPRGCFIGFDGWNVEPETTLVKAYEAAANSLAPTADVATRDALIAGFTGSPDAYNVLQSREAFAVHQPWLDKYKERYEPGVWQRIDRARHWTAAQIAEAEAKRTQVQATWSQFFSHYDFLILPATPFPALIKADCTPTNRARLLTLTRPVSLGGLPALTIPLALGSGLTTGMQVVAPLCNSRVFTHVLALAKT